MNRAMLSVFAAFSASGLMLADSAVKGALLLTLAAVASLMLRRESAATRHLVWLLAIVAILIVPMLSAMLPQWRVLPAWAGHSAKPTASEIRFPLVAGSVDALEWPGIAEATAVEPPSAMVHQPVAPQPDSRPAQARSEVARETAVGEGGSGVWFKALPMAWALGFSILMLRLIAARWLLWSSERRATAIGSSMRPAWATDDPIVTALQAACSRLGIRRSVTLLIHPEKTIPVVWGILRCRMMLPAAARRWSDEQLRSVLLHELAHVKRRDALAQLLTQVACALHWFNPLAWFAASRLGVERERACDDLVLASGVRPSAYAEHLLEVVSGLSPNVGTHSCALAMARKSSIEGRLTAVLSGNRNRRGVTRVLAAAAMIVVGVIAVPLAMMHAAEPEKVKTETVSVADIEPKDANSKPLFKDWKTSARSDGKIPGGRIGEMAASLKTFISLNPGHEQSVKLEPVLKKCDAARDWTQAEAAALLDEIAAITPRAEWAMRSNSERRIHQGKPLPAELADAPWGQPAANGLRIAWLLEPRSETRALESVMKSRVIFHNAGKAPVCFATDDWIQNGGHQAKGADGKNINVWAVERMGLRSRMVFRLAPGECAEAEGHGIGVGSHETSSEKSIYRVGCWIEAKEGDAVTFAPGGVPVSFQTWRDNEGLKDSITVWREMIALRVMQESPMPTSAADRELLLRRVIKDLFGTDPSAAEVAAFVADDAKEPLERLIQKLQTRAQAMHFAGQLSGGETRFRVTAAAPKQDKPKAGARLKTTTEQKLKWGEPANGLRMALAWPPALGEPAMGDAQDFYLVVQNASQAEIRLIANDAAPNPRRLIMRSHGSPLSAISDAAPMPGDWLLQPGEAAIFRLFHSEEKARDGRTIGAVIEEDIRGWPQHSVTAEMSIEKASSGAWTGKLRSGETRGSVDVIPPNHKDAQALYKSWTTAARLDGKIPGGVIALLGQSVRTFIKNNPTWKTTPRLEKMLPRFDASRDWGGQEAVALLDELAAVQDTPIRMALDHETEGLIRSGSPLPPDLAMAPWGQALENGLRHAWLLEPRSAEHRLGTPLRARILIHNAGKTSVVFRTRSWHQLGHTASDAKGAALKVDSVEWLTRGRLTLFRLAPGEFIEASAPGIGVGPMGNSENWRNTRVGSWIEAKAGDEVTVTTAPLPLSDWNDKTELDGEQRWWLDHIAARLSRHLPFPDDAKARELLLYRVAMELFGTPVGDEPRTAFVADHTPTALDSLAKNLFHRPGPELLAWAGPLTSAPTKFRVLPADPKAALRAPIIQSDAEKPKADSPKPAASAPASETPKEK